MSSEQFGLCCSAQSFIQLFIMSSFSCGVTISRPRNAQSFKAPLEYPARMKQNDSRLPSISSQEILILRVRCSRMLNSSALRPSSSHASFKGTVVRAFWPLYRLTARQMASQTPQSPRRFLMASKFDKSSCPFPDVKCEFAGGAVGVRRYVDRAA